MGLTIMEPNEIKPKEFNQFARLVYDQTGIRLEAQKKDLLQARLRKRLRALAIPTFKDYYRFLTEDESGVELIQMIDCVTTNKTEFFRESGHFEHLIRTALPALGKGLPAGEPLRLWSAACSTGEEVYSLAMTALETLGGSRPVKVLGTDISTRVLGKAMEGCYEKDKVANVPMVWRSKYFLTERGEEDEMFYRVGHELKETARFSRLNLNGDDLPFRSRFDAIFCRNVMIYFDQDVQQKLIDRLTVALKSGGFLYTGHSESLLRIRHGLKAVAPSVYVKP